LNIPVILDLHNYNNRNGLSACVQRGWGNYADNRNKK